MPDNFNDEPSTSTGGEEARRQHKYSSKDMKPERPWKRWCFTGICCLIVIGIMIVLSIYMQKWFDPPEDEDWSDDEVPEDQEGGLSGASALLPKTVDYLEDVCSEQRLGQDDRSTCEEACEPAKDCCNVFENGNSTCFDEQGAGCFTYAKCHSLDGFIDPAHHDLDRICHKDNIEVNRAECELACTSVQCCYLEHESCVSSNFQACMDYAACQNLKDDSIDVAPVDLDERCGKETPTCKRDCREALACSDPNSKAYRENFLTCLSYLACNDKSDTMITVAPMHSFIPVAPDILADVCSVKGFADFGGPDKCLEACAEAQCCWNDSEAGGCFGDDPLGCMAYQRCTILNQPEYAGLTYPPTAARPQEPAAAAAAASEDAPTETPVQNDNNTTEAAPTVAPTLASASNQTEETLVTTANQTQEEVSAANAEGR